MLARKLTDGVALGVDLTILVVVARRQQLAVFDDYGADLGFFQVALPPLAASASASCMNCSSELKVMTSFHR